MGNVPFFGGPADISITARYTAAAWEHLGLPHAKRFADPVGRVLLRAGIVRDRLLRGGFSLYDDLLVPRHLYLDQALRRGGARQVVEIAAGFSPRGLMLASEGIRYIEVDRDNVIAEKRRRCGDLADRLQLVAADAMQPDFAQRVLAHCDPALGSVLVNEGMAPYFGRADYLKLLGNLRGIAQPLSAPLLTDFYLRPPRHSLMSSLLGVAQVFMRTVADRFHLYARDEREIRELFAEGGWTVLSVAAPAQDSRYRRRAKPLRWDALRIVEARPK